MTKRLLMIAYAFPPSLSTGRMRTVKFCKYLPRFGWQPVVVAPQPRSPCNLSLLAEIPPDTELHRVRDSGALAEMAVLGSRIKGLPGLLRSRRRSDPGARRSAPPAARTAAGGLNMLLYWPDLRATWILPAFRKALELARHCDAIYSTGWPMSDHIVAWRVARLTGLPWVMDHRDPWTVSRLRAIYTTRFQDRLFNHFERACIRTAAYLVNVTESLTEEHVQAFAAESPAKFVTIHNGFDPEDFEGLPPPVADFPLTMTYLGTLYAGRSPLLILRALAGLLRAGRLAPGDLLAQFIGSAGGEFAEQARQLGVDRFVRFQPRIPYPAALAALARSHVALLLGGPEADTISMSTKVYEYLFMQKPILAVLPPGMQRELVTAAGAACAGTADTEAVERIIMEMLTEFRRQHSLAPPRGLPDLQKYSRRHAAGQLTRLLDSLVPADQG